MPPVASWRHLNGDGQDEWIVLLTNPNQNVSTAFGSPEMILIVNPGGGERSRDI